MAEIDCEGLSTYTHKCSVNCACIGHKKGYVAATGSRDGIKIWTFGRPKAISHFRNGSIGQTPTAMAFDTSENVLAVAFDDGVINIWDLTSSKSLRTYYSEEESDEQPQIVSLVFHPYSTFLASLDEDDEIRIWDVRKKNFIQVYKPKEKTNTIAFSPDGRWLCTSGVGIRFWDLTNGKLIKVLEDVPKCEFAHSVFSSEEFVLVSCTSDAKLVFHDLETFNVLSRIDLPYPVRRLGFGPENKYILGIGDTGKCIIVKNEAQPQVGELKMDISYCEDVTIQDGESMILSVHGNQMELIKFILSSSIVDSAFQKKQETESNHILEDEEKSIDEDIPNPENWRESHTKNSNRAASLRIGEEEPRFRGEHDQFLEKVRIDHVDVLAQLSGRLETLQKAKAVLQQNLNRESIESAIESLDRRDRGACVDFVHLLSNYPQLNLKMAIKVVRLAVECINGMKRGNKVDPYTETLLDAIHKIIRAFKPAIDLARNDDDDIFKQKNDFSMEERIENGKILLQLIQSQGDYIKRISEQASGQCLKRAALDICAVMG